MEVLDAIYTRRTVRSFIDKKIDKKIIDKIIDAGIHAPSACDIQGWKFIVVENKKIIQKIVDKGAATFIKNAPVNIFVLYDNQTNNMEYKDHLLSAAACIQNMLLAANNFNLGCCWVCHLPLKRQLRSILRIPSHYDPIACIVMGYPKKKPKPLPRRYKLDELIAHNKFTFKEKKRGTTRLMLKRAGRKIYYLLPFRKYVKPIVDKKFEKKFN